MGEFDDEICHCGHSKGYHGQTALDKHGGGCEKCGKVGTTRFNGVDPNEVKVRKLRSRK